MDKTHFKKLVSKHLSGKTTPEEERLLLNYYDALQEKKILWDEEEMGNQENVKQKLYENTLTEITNRENKNKQPIIFFNWQIAAALITLFSTVIYFYLKEPNVQIVKQKLKPVHNDISPGGNKAILTLADGKQIVLDNTDDGTITTQGNISVSKSKDGQLVYQIGKNDQSGINPESVFNTISTPIGGQYQVILSDNTKVWLNASSSIKFPTAFTANERKVVIEGEAYFEVAKDTKRPFKVLSNHQIIEVLGTHFNVNAYNDEAFIKTTLLEGSVKISSGSLNTMLKPGQQARLSSGTKAIDIINIDPEEAVAWKNGLFMFDNEDIHSIMRKISRWYGVEVVYQENEINETFGGTISKFENVSQVLKILEVTGTIHFKIEGRRITVMK